MKPIERLEFGNWWRGSLGLGFPATVVRIVGLMTRVPREGEIGVP